MGMKPAVKQTNLFTYQGDQKIVSATDRNSIEKGGYKLIMQTDGNLVLYNAANKAVWASGTNSKGKGPFEAVMQKDGNFVVYDSSRKPLWASGTNKGAGKYEVYVSKYKQLRIGRLIDNKWHVLWQVPAPPARPSTGNDVQKSASSAPVSAFSNALIEFGPGNRVIDCKGGTCKKGANLHIWDPHGGANQSWTYDPTKKTVTAQGVCMDVSGSGTKNGTNVQTWSCNGGKAQEWVVQKNVGPGQGSVQLMNPNSGKCLDVSGAADKQGQNLQIWDCTRSGHSWDIRENRGQSDKKSNDASGVITQGATLTSGTPTASVSNAKGLKLVMQTDGNLVLYDAAKKALWASGTSRKGTGPYRLLMQPDGNLVLYDAKKAPLWHTNTYGKGKAPYKAVVQEDGNFVVYDTKNTPLWASKGSSASSKGKKSTWGRAKGLFGL